MRRMNLQITDHLIGTATYDSTKKQFRLQIKSPTNPLPTRFMLVIRSANGSVSVSKPYFAYGPSSYGDMLYHNVSGFESTVNVAFAINKNAMNFTFTINTVDNLPTAISTAIMYVYGV